MNPERLRLIEELFHELITVPPERRAGELEQRCGADTDLRAEVLNLLAGHSRAESEDFLVPPGSTAFTTVYDRSPSGWIRGASPGASLHIRCPNCNIATEIIVPDVPEKITCPACQHSIELNAEKWPGIPRSPFPDGSQKFSRFEISDLVGFGAFGNVYKAFDPALQKQVALKVLRAGSHARFIEDARTSAQLRHPSIVSANEVSTHEGIPFIVSDFIDGSTLAEWLRSNRPTYSETARLMKTLAEALEYAHQRGVIHRDFKPSNIMIDKVGKPYLLDFGLAKREASEVTMTLDGQILGTAAYMSPEQARGDAHHVTSRSDIYSLGVVLYEMITGAPPFRGTLRTLIYQVLNDEPRPPRTLNEHIPRDLETICLRCMSKEPARRYATAREVAEDLELYLTDQPIKARPIGALERFWRWCRRNSRLAAAIAAAAASLVVIAVLSLIFAVSRGTMLAESNTREARVNFELAKAAFDRGEISHGLHYLVRTRDAAQAAGNADWVRVSQASLAAWSRELPVLKGVYSHDAWVRDANFSPDGKTVLTSSVDGTAKLWDIATGKNLRTFRHQGIVYSGTFSPDGKLVVTGSSDKTARIWETSTGLPRGEPMKHEDEVIEVKFSPDGRAVATASDDGTARLWDAQTGLPLVEPMKHAMAVRSVAFSPDGKIVATAGGDKLAKLWDRSTGQPIGEPLAHDDAVWMLAFSPDGKTLATASGDTSARLWNVDLRRNPIKLSHTQSIVAIAFSPDGKTLISGGFDKTVSIWNSMTGERQGVPLPHGGSVLSLAFSPDGRRFVSASTDHTARVWDIATAQQVGETFRHEADLSSATFSPDGSNLITCSMDRTAKLWDLSGGQPSSHPKVRFKAGSTKAVSPDGKTILVGTDEGLLTEYDALTGLEKAASFRPFDPGVSTSRISSIAFRPDGLAILVGTDQGLARLCDLRDRKPIGDPLKVSSFVLITLFSPDGKTGLVAGVSGVSLLCDGQNGKPIGNPIRHPRNLSRAIFRPDSKTALIASDDGTVRLLDAATGEIQSTLRHDRSIYWLDVSPDGKTLVTACQDGYIRLWDLATGKLRFEPIAQNGPVYLAIFSNDGRSILSAGQGGSIRLWESSTGQPRRNVAMLQFPSTVTAASFNIDDQTIAVGDRDGNVWLWDAASGHRIGPPLKNPRIIREIVFRSDGKTLMVRSDEPTIRFWDLPPRTLETTQIRDWLQAKTGLQLDAKGDFTVLDQPAWVQSRQWIRAADASPR